MKGKDLLGFEFPRLSDPRWQLLLFLSCYTAFQLMGPGFSKNLSQLLMAFLGGFCLDGILFRFFLKSKAFPMSGLISAIGTFDITDSPHLWPYFTIAALAIASKFLLRINGKHIFNPTNFSLVILTILFGQEFSTAAGRWGGQWFFSLIMLLLGLSLAYRAGRLIVALSFILTFLAGVALRSFVLSTKFLLMAGPSTGAAFQLFVFYMLTDPVTTPKSRWSQFLFGCMVAAVDCWFRYKSVRDTPFYALFIVTAIYSFFRTPQTTMSSLHGFKKFSGWA